MKNIELTFDLTSTAFLLFINYFGCFCTYHIAVHNRRVYCVQYCNWLPHSVNKLSKYVASVYSIIAKRGEDHVQW